MIDFLKTNRLLDLNTVGKSKAVRKGLLVFTNLHEHKKPVLRTQMCSSDVLVSALLTTFLLLHYSWKLSNRNARTNKPHTH